MKGLPGLDRDSKPPDGKRNGKGLGRILRSFWFNVLLVTLGLLFGELFQEWGAALYPVGEIYLSLLTMCIVPIVFTAIVSGLAEMLRGGAMHHYFKRIAAVYLASVMLGASLGVFAAWIGQPGRSLNTDARKAIGTLLLKQNSTPTGENDSETGVAAFLKRAIPDNLFRVLGEGKTLPIVIASILMGVALGLGRSDASERVLHFMKGILEVFNRILGWVLYALPLALFALSAALIATSGWAILSAFSRVLILIYSCCLAMCVLYAFSMRWATHHPISHVLSSLWDALGLALFSNSLVAMPLAMDRMEDKLKLPGPIVRMVMPLGTVMNRHIYPLIFALMAVMTAQFYEHALSYVSVGCIVLTSAVVGMAAVGNLAVVAPFVQEVLQPLGLPPGFAIIILIESAALINPFVKLTQLFGACATTSVICKENQPEIRTQEKP